MERFYDCRLSRISIEERNIAGLFISILFFILFNTAKSFRAVLEQKNKTYKILCESVVAVPLGNVYQYSKYNKYQ